MKKSRSRKPSLQESITFRDFLRQGLAEVDRSFEVMARDQVEIDRLAASSQANLDAIRVLSKQTDALIATLNATEFRR